MSLTRYTGNSPMRVSKDAKYSITAGGEIRLEFRESERVRYLLTTDEHPRLVAMVNAVKQSATGQNGGAFYINEYQHVLVPDGQGGGCYFAGTYDATLEFRERDLLVSPVAPATLRPGDRWPGPHVGIKYTLASGASEIRYEKVDGRRREEVWLSDTAGPSATSRLARRIAAVKGPQGGGFFINERQELFAPLAAGARVDYQYIGSLGDDVWFPPPSEFGATYN